MVRRTSSGKSSPENSVNEQDELLRNLGLFPGEEVRFRRADRGRWQSGHIARVERDGSITVHDSDGAARSLRPERLEVKRRGRGRSMVWHPVSEVAVTSEQLTLF